MSTDLTIVLIGETGNGKCATGNTLLGQTFFESVRTANAVTNKCSIQSAKAKSGTYYVIDTPGLFDIHSIAKRAMDVQTSLEICRNPNAFLLVLNSATKVTPEDLHTITILKLIFGHEIVKYTIVVFTHGEDFETEEEFEEFWKSAPPYRNLVAECQNRVCRIANKGGLQHTKFWEHPIYDKILQMSENGTKKYNYEYSEQHALALQRHINTFNENMSIMEQIKTIAEDISKEVQEERTRRQEEEKKRQEEAILQERELLRTQQEELSKREEEGWLREEAADQRIAEMNVQIDEQKKRNHTEEVWRLQKHKEKIMSVEKERQEKEQQRLLEAKNETECMRKREIQLIDDLHKFELKKLEDDKKFQLMLSAEREKAAAAAALSARNREKQQSSCIIQ